MEAEHDQKPAPCVGCDKQNLCKSEKLACKAFAIFCKVLIKRHDEEPNKEIYLKIFEGE